MMIQGHAFDVLLPTSVRGSTGFHLWLFGRGLTSCLFLCLSGFVFTISAHRRWDAYMQSVSANLKQARRLALFLALGYLLHLPAAKLAHIPFLSDELWRSFLAVDVLQCIAVSLLVLQVLMLVARTTTRFAVAAGGACLLVVALAPLAWRMDHDMLSPGVAAFVSSNTGSLFPLFPWSAFVFMGAVFGHLCLRQTVRDPRAWARRVFLPGGIGLLTVASICFWLPWQPFGPSDYWSTSPTHVLLRAGLVAMLVSAAAYLTRFLSQPPAIVRSLAQESLIVYVVHVCLVYGSSWNAGLLQLRGRTETLLPAIGYVVLLWVGMAAIATAWNQCKQHEAGIARWMRIATVGALAVRLL